jgi:colicin import membrane protein
MIYWDARAELAETTAKLAAERARAEKAEAERNEALVRAEKAEAERNEALVRAEKAEAERNEALVRAEKAKDIVDGIWHTTAHGNQIQARILQQAEVRAEKAEQAYQGQLRRSAETTAKLAAERARAEKAERERDQALAELVAGRYCAWEQVQKVVRERDEALSKLAVVQAALAGTVERNEARFVAKERARTEKAEACLAAIQDLLWPVARVDREG